MKLSQKEIRRIIQEELQIVINEITRREFLLGGVGLIAIGGPLGLLSKHMVDLGKMAGEKKREKEEKKKIRSKLNLCGTKKQAMEREADDMPIAKPWSKWSPAQGDKFIQSVGEKSLIYKDRIWIAPNRIPKDYILENGCTAKDTKKFYETWDYKDLKNRVMGNSALWAYSQTGGDVSAQEFASAAGEGEKSKHVAFDKYPGKHWPKRKQPPQPEFEGREMVPLAWSVAFSVLKSKKVERREFEERFYKMTGEKIVIERDFDRALEQVEEIIMLDDVSFTKKAEQMGFKDNPCIFKPEKERENWCGNNGYGTKEENFMFALEEITKEIIGFKEIYEKI